jgi:hypothetical protein
MDLVWYPSTGHKQAVLRPHGDVRTQSLFV